MIEISRKNIFYFIKKDRTKSDTSRYVEYTKAIKRIISKELGKMTS